MKQLLLPILFLFALLTGCQSTEEPYIASKGESFLTVTEWKIDNYLGLDKSVKEYSMSPRKDMGNMEEAWGTFVVFSENGTFQSFERQMCGNSCFKTIYGKYFLEVNNKLIISVDSVKTECWVTNHTEKIEKRIGEVSRFSISKNNDDLKLSKL